LKRKVWLVKRGFERRIIDGNSFSDLLLISSCIQRRDG
jgi:hypothetical protein